MNSKLLPELAKDSTEGGYVMKDGDVFTDGKITVKRKYGLTLVRINRGE